MDYLAGNVQLVIAIFAVKLNIYLRTFQFTLGVIYETSRYT